MAECLASAFHGPQYIEKVDDEGMTGFMFLAKTMVYLTKFVEAHKKQ